MPPLPVPTAQDAVVFEMAARLIKVVFVLSFATPAAIDIVPDDPAVDIVRPER